MTVETVLRRIEKQCREDATAFRQYKPLVCGKKLPVPGPVACGELDSPHRCDTCSNEFVTCDSSRVVWGVVWCIDRDPAARGADIDKVLDCDAYTPNTKGNQA